MALVDMYKSENLIGGKYFDPSMYKSENLIGGKYFDPSLLREFGFEDMVNRLLRHPQWSKDFEWRGPTYTPVTYEFLAWDMSL